MNVAQPKSAKAISSRPSVPGCDGTCQPVGGPCWAEPLALINGPGQPNPSLLLARHHPRRAWPQTPHFTSWPAETLIVINGPGQPGAFLTRPAQSPALTSIGQPLNFINRAWHAACPNPSLLLARSFASISHWPRVIPSLLGKLFRVVRLGLGL